jgi:hypothetical protein
LTDGIAKLDVQSVIAGAITDAFSNSKLEEAADAIEVRVNPRYRGKGLGVGGAFQASAPEAASENLSPRAARLAGEGIEAGEIVLIDAE